MGDRISAADFVVIGGGVFGCAIAWNLARRSAGSVLLLERRDLAAAVWDLAGIFRCGLAKWRLVPGALFLETQGAGQGGEG